LSTFAGTTRDGRRATLERAGRDLVGDVVAGTQIAQRRRQRIDAL